MPDFYRGTWKDPTSPDVVQFIKDQTTWSKLKVDLEKVLSFAKKKGAATFGAVGTCWGSYMVLRECAYPEFKAGASWHPSHSPIAGLVGDDEKDMLSQVKCVQLFMPANGDAPSCYPGGLGEQILGDKLEIVPFKDMQHGWTVRGDMTDPAVARDVKKAIQDTLEFLQKNM